MIIAYNQYGYLLLYFASIADCLDINMFSYVMWKLNNAKFQIEDKGFVCTKDEKVLFSEL